MNKLDAFLKQFNGMISLHRLASFPHHQVLSEIKVSSIRRPKGDLTCELGGRRTMSI